jgi:hypothetical protein
MGFDKGARALGNRTPSSRYGWLLPGFRWPPKPELREACSSVPSEPSLKGYRLELLSASPFINALDPKFIYLVRFFG